MATNAEELAALYVERTELRAKIRAACSAPLQVSVAGSVSYQERSIGELRTALEIVEQDIASRENLGGLVRVLPRYY